MLRTLVSTLALSCVLIAPVAFAQVGDSAQVKRLTIRTDTANEDNAKTTSDFFFCYGGRELDLDTSHNDRENNQIDTYEYGTPTSNVINAKENSPAVGPIITMGMVHKHPVVIRMADNDSDHWIVKRVEAEFKDANGTLLGRYCFVGRAILGPSTGMALPLADFGLKACF